MGGSEMKSFNLEETSSQRGISKDGDSVFSKKHENKNNKKKYILKRNNAKMETRSTRTAEEA